MESPSVSVVMTIYNGERYLIDSLASIVEQSFQDWELLCVNDGSQDRSGEILRWFAECDPRIRILEQENAGIVQAANRGCYAANAPLICRMDCDDIAYPHRLQVQYDFMRDHPQHVAVGGAILEIDNDSDPLGLASLPTNHPNIVDNLLTRRTGLFNPASMLRKSAFEAVGGYRPEFLWVEDHDLWLRLSDEGLLHNLTDLVLCYRQHATSTCWQRASLQRELMNQLLTEAYQQRGKSVPPELLLAEKSYPKTSAGPGKWARKAAKGGHVHSTFKHLHHLLRSDSKWSYKSRMTFESLLRLIGGSPRRLIAGSPTVRVPSFPHWHAQHAERTVPRSNPSKAA